MSLRTRIAALTAGAVALAVIALSVSMWILMRRELREQVDKGLVDRVLAAALPGPGPELISSPDSGSAKNPFGLDNSIQLIDSSGNVLVPASPEQELPVSAFDMAVASGRSDPYLHDERVGGVHLRVVTASLAPGQAIQMARVLNEVDATLRSFVLILVLLAAVGVAAAAGAGYVVARGAVRPVEQLTSAAEHVALTQQLDARIEEARGDELGRLARTFNQMLAALEESRSQQQRLVADASHELRTPLTSLRTNVEVLARNPEMDEGERERVMVDLRTELEELSELVGELVALATDQRAADVEELTDLDLSEVVSSAVERTRRRTGREVVLEASASPMTGRPLALERAVTNLLDNAHKWSPPDVPIGVSVAGGRVEVSDRGPGIAQDDLPLVFDRFYRATAARSMPGSGLGLAIVKQVAETHGGRVWAGEREGGGAVVGFEVPPADPADAAAVDGALESSADS